jgi:uncharacterized protein (DUF1330 family)
MSAYVLFDNLEVFDAAKLEEYKREVAPLVAQHGGRYVVLGGPAEPVEGDWSLRYPVMIEFPTLEAARAWYHGDAYRPLRALRHAAVRSSGMILAGLPDAPAR